MKTIKCVSVTVRSVIDNTENGLPVGDPERTVIAAVGSLSDEDGVLTVRYAEEGEDGQRTDVTLVKREGGVILSRRGSVVVDLVFEEGKECRTVYSVPPYKFDMTVNTKKIRSTLCGSGGELQLIYDMNVGGQKKRVRLHLSVTE
ncbi:MAG: DUF1934 domain-containing protein [Clostridia bacterium]|nr:DUF1934 domain-containing protein [Clostridia bacterium]